MKSLNDPANSGKNKKPDLKSYEQDGNHIHNENDPMGLHTHKEIEKGINDIWNAISGIQEKFWKIQDDISGLKGCLETKAIDDGIESPTKAYGMKSKNGGNTMSQEPTNDPAVQPAEPKEPAQAPAEPVQPTEPAPAQAEPVAPVEPAQASEPTPDMKSLMDSNVALKTQLKDLTEKFDKFDKIMSKPNMKSLQEPTKTDPKESKIISPLKRL